MIDVLDAKELYLSYFNAACKQNGANGDDSLRALRVAAMDRFAEIGFPTLRDEEWRFTPLTKLAEVPFQPAEPGRALEMEEDELAALLPPTGPSKQITLVGGEFAPRLSNSANLPAGVVMGSLAAALRSRRELVEPHLAKYVRLGNAPFAALNTAFLSDGLFVYLPRGTVLREPLHLVYVSLAGDEPTVFHPRTLIVCESNAQATIVQSYLGVDRGEAVTFTNAVTEIVLGPNSQIDHCKIQRETTKAFHFETLQIQHERDSRFVSQAINLGGGLVRNEINALLAGEGCECTLNGLYVASGTQHIDNRTTIDHAKPHCASHELYKGILDGKAKGVFNGKIFVRQDAQKTDAKQTNKTLLLSDDATINTKPQLEIFADDVKCTHGATIGQLASEAIFYLRSRGIGLEQARAILTYAFAEDVLQRITVEPLRRELENFFLAVQHLPAELRGDEAP
jgi:Fe-S cluster assembly protein SufD